jgi:hypothetical protein
MYQGGDHVDVWCQSQLVWVKLYSNDVCTIDVPLATEQLVFWKMGSKIVLTLIDNLKLDWVCFYFWRLLDYDYLKYQDKRMSKEHHKETARD